MSKKELDPTFHIYDADGKIRSAAARIGKRSGVGGTTGAIRYAVNFVDAAQKTVSAPIDYASAPLDLLRDYAVHGYDFTIRAPALAEIERRYMSVINEHLDSGETEWIEGEAQS